MFKLLYKAPGQSSFMALRAYQRQHQIRKIGHTGTLDPLAQGLLLVATDDDTKLIPYLNNHDKRYRVKLKLGEVSATYDREGPLSFVSGAIPSLTAIQSALNQLRGVLAQVPPPFSAKKVAGRRAYQLARQQQKVVLKPQMVEIKAIEQIRYTYPYVCFEVWVSSGTYIRTLVHDLGQILGVGAHLVFLERTMVNGLDQSALARDIDPLSLVALQPLQLTVQQLQQLYQGLKPAWLKGVPATNYALLLKGQIVGIFKPSGLQLFGKRIQQLLAQDAA